VFSTHKKIFQKYIHTLKNIYFQKEKQKTEKLSPQNSSFQLVHFLASNFPAQLDLERSS